MSIRLPLALAAGVLAAALPTAAHAATIDAANTGQLNAALTQATAAAGPTTIHVAAGDYQGPFAYAGSGSLTLTGPTAGRATIHAATGDVGLWDQSAAHADISHVAFSVDGNATGLRAGGPADVDDVAFSTGPKGSGTLAVIDHSGVHLAGVSFLGNAATTGVLDLASGPASIESANVFFTSTAVSVIDPGADLDVRRARIRMPAKRGVSVRAGKVALSDSIIDFGSSSAVGLVATDDGDPSNAHGSITATRDTVVGDGTTAQIAARVTPSSPGDLFSISLADAIVDGVQTPFACTLAKGTGVGVVLSDYSRIPAGSSDSCGGAFTFSHPVVAADAGFADPAHGDFHLGDGSPLIDAGDPAVHAAAHDLDDKPRPAVGHAGQAARLDLGAFERQTPVPAAPVPPTTPVPPSTPVAPAQPAAATARPAPASAASSPAAVAPSPSRPAPAGRDLAAPVLSGARVTRTQLRFTLSEAASVAVSVARRGHGRPARARVTRVSAAAGANVRSRRAAPFARLRPGRYSVRLVATDRAGNASAPVTLTVTVTRRRA